MMNKVLLSGIFLLSLVAQAETVWITDDLRTGVLKEPSDASGINATLVAGEAVEKVGVSKNGKFIHIRQGKIDGWVRERNVTDSPSIRAKYEDLQNQFNLVSQKMQHVASNEEDSQQKLDKIASAYDKAKAEAQKAKEELLQLKRASENVVAIDKLNKELQNKVATLEQSNVVLTQQNNQLQASQNKRQMIIGGAFVFGGMLLFWLLSTLIAMQRRRSTFSDF